MVGYDRSLQQRCYLRLGARSASGDTAQSRCRPALRGRATRFSHRSRLRCNLTGNEVCKGADQQVKVVPGGRYPTWSSPACTQPRIARESSVFVCRSVCCDASRASWQHGATWLVLRQRWRRVRYIPGCRGATPAPANGPASCVQVRIDSRLARQGTRADRRRPALCSAAGETT